MEHIFVYSLQEDAALMELIVDIIIEFPVWRIARLLTKIKIFLEGADLVLLDRIWRALVALPNKHVHYMLVIINFPTMIMVLLNSTKFSLGILAYGVRLKMWIYCHIKDMLSLNTSIVVWRSSQNSAWPTSLWIVQRSWQSDGQTRIPIREWHRTNKKMKEECC